ncbi:alpha/beta hydrolase [Pseudonocardia humida]|uniref:Alpha/beta hydrolase fold domain-containing protein n=1 Tax=Pseudonocardia humida TaxID=2800819 RepID=A0ABT1A2A1_9PSEU|nr:alpha/beta hydrolase [Pseudonocardia humida]MCO1657136.1 alpha/beta hydrolase fold domain-containing protein [Pseudonocardia humida]
MVQIDPVQAQTISAEAAAHIAANSPIAIPDPQLTQQFADQLNAQLDALNGPFLSALRRNLRLSVRGRAIDGVPVVRIRPRKIRRSRRDVAGIFVHGGGFALLNARDYVAYRMAHALGIVVYSVDYRRSPRAQFPVALDQTARVHRAILRRYDGVVAAGSSAGANLLVSSVLRARRRGGLLPRAAALLEPAVDLRAIGDSYVANDGRDPLASRDTILKFSSAYLGATPAVAPEASPLLADFGPGFVPTIITSGTRDLLQSDAARLHRALLRADVPADLRVWEGMWHAFAGVPGLPEGEQAMAEVFGFLDRHL